MGTHPIFESDFDCLTEKNEPRYNLRRGGNSVECESREARVNSRCVKRTRKCNYQSRSNCPAHSSGRRRGNHLGTSRTLQSALIVRLDWRPCPSRMLLQIPRCLAHHDEQMLLCP